MAVNLLGASDARVEFGDIAAVAGLTAITVSITINASAVADGERICGQWGSEANNGAFLIQWIGTDEIGFVVHNGTGTYCGRQTTGTNFATGSVYRIVARWRSSAKAIDIWVNGASQTVTSWVADGNVAALTNSARTVYVGREQDSSTDGIDADFSEFAIHSSYMPDDYCITYGKGYSPAFYRSNGILYAPLISTGSLQDVWGGATGTNTSGTSSAHPSVYRPSAQILRFPSTVASGTTVSVPAGSLTLTGYAPTVATTANQTIAVPAGSLVITGYAPTVRVGNDQIVVVPAGSLNLTGFAPTIVTTNNKFISVPAGTLVLTGYAPTVLGGEVSNRGSRSWTESERRLNERLRRLALQQARWEDDEEALAILLASIIRR